MQFVASVVLGNQFLLRLCSSSTGSWWHLQTPEGNNAGMCTWAVIIRGGEGWLRYQVAFVDNTVQWIEVMA